MGCVWVMVVCCRVLLLRTLAHLCLEEGEANIAEKAVVGIPSSAKEVGLTYL